MEIKKTFYINHNAELFPVNLGFLPHRRKNSEMRQGGQESKVRIYLSQNTLSEGERAGRWVAAALGFFGKPVMRGIQMKRWDIHWGRRGLGVVFLDFHSSSTFPREGGIFVLFYLWSEVSWHQGMIGTSYLHDYFYCNDGIMSNRLNLDAGDSRLSPPFFVCLQGTYHPKCAVSCQSGGSCFSLSAHGTPLFTRCVISCHLAPAPFLCSYLATCLL